MFVCERPSVSGGILSPADLRFYELLKKHRFECVHITVLVTCRGTAGTRGSREIDNCRLFLEEEIKILKPSLIIAVGCRVKKILADKRISCSAPVVKITNYSYRYTQPDKLKEKLNEEFIGIKEVYREIVRTLSR